MATRIRRAVALKGFARSPERLAHKNMLSRCYDPKNIGYHRYGGRGITVCERWRGEGGFDRFYSDVGPKPTKRHSIERINNDGHYEPANIRWATIKEQGRNQSTNRLITFQGETKTLQDWANTIGASKNALWARLEVYGWPIEKALSVPFLKQRGKLTFDGQTMPMAAWSRKLGLPTEVIRTRLRKGWTVDRALTTPYKGSVPSLPSKGLGKTS